MTLFFVVHSNVMQGRTALKSSTIPRDCRVSGDKVRNVMSGV